MGNKKSILGYSEHLVRRWFVFSLSFIATSLLWAQNPVLQFKTFGVENGFSDSRISEIVQDVNGIVWTVSRLGINRYDGDQVAVYHLRDNLRINDLAKDGDGHIVAATSRGLYSFSSASNAFIAVTTSSEKSGVFLRNIFFKIIPASGGGYWLAGSAGTFYWFDALKNPKEHKTYKTYHAGRLSPDVDPSAITALAEDSEGRLWLGDTKGRVFQFDPDTHELNQLKNIENHFSINDLMVGSANRLWVATNGNGLFRYTIETRGIKKFESAGGLDNKTINNDVVLSLFEGLNDRVYIGTDGGGINLFEPESGRFSYFRQGRGKWNLPDNSVLCFAQGIYGLVWAGTVHGGVSCFRDEINVYNIPPERLAFGKDKQSSKILEDQTGNLWITAGRSGLRKYSPKTAKTTVFGDYGNENKGLNGNIALSLYQDEFERIWIGTLRGGLNVYDTGGERFLAFPERKGLKRIYSITKGGGATIWVGTSNGVVVFDQDLKVVDHINTQTCKGFSNNVVTSIFKDVKGDMWVGTEKGLNLLSPTGGHLKSYYSSGRDSTSLSGDHVLSIAEGPDLSIYVGTYGFGLNRYSRRTHNFQRIGPEEGLQAGVIRDILVDQQDDLWLSTNLGMSRINGKKIENYGLAEGFPPFYGGAASLARDGRIYFAGNEGLSFFNPAELNKESRQPQVFFTNFKIIKKDGKTVLNPKRLEKTESKLPQLVLSPGFKLFTVNFSSTDYFDPGHTHYYYQLEGLDDDWHALENQKSLSFSNLAPGAYKLHIAATKEPQMENTQRASLDLKVLPSFWQRKTTQLFGLVLVILIIYFTVNLRNRSIKKQRNKLKKQVAQRTEEVKQEKDRAHKNEMGRLEIEKQNEQLKQKRLGDELRFKTEELTNSTLRTVHKNHLLHRIKEALSKEAKKNKDQKTRVQPLINEIEETLRIDADWDAFYNLFHQVHPNFIQGLKESKPSLTDRELRLCALIKLNFPSQQIATLFGISLSSVKVARHRLRKKLDMEKGASFEEFFDHQKLA